MALMASTMSSLQETVKIIEENEHVSRHTEEVDKIIKKIKVETGMEKLPDILKKIAGEYADILLIIAINHIVRPEAMDLVGEWYEDSYKLAKLLRLQELPEVLYCFSHFWTK